MSLLKQTAQQSFLYVCFQVIGLILSFLSFPIMTRIFSVSEYGDLALVNAILAILIPFAKCGMPTSVIKQYALNATETDKTILYSSSLGGISIYFTIVFVVYSIIALFTKNYFVLNIKQLLLVIGIALLSRSMQSLFSGFYRSEEKVLTLNVVGIIFRVGSIIVGITTCLLIIKGLYGYLLGTVVFEGVMTLWMIGMFYWKNVLDVKMISLSEIKTLFAFGFPLICFEASSLVNDYADRFLIKYFLDSTQLGIYSVGYNLSLYVQGFITAPIWMTVFPIYTKLWETQGMEKTASYLATILKAYLCIAILVLCGTLLVSKEFVILAATEKYYPAAQVVPFVTGSILLYGTYHITGAGFYLLNKTKLIAMYMVICAMLHIVLNVYLIPKYQIMGAAYSTVISYIVLTFLFTKKANSLLRIRWPIKDAIVYMTFGVITALALWHVHLSNIVATLLIKFFACLTLYMGLVFLYDRNLRVKAVSLIRNRAR